jgi:hypothetical protein
LSNLEFSQTAFIPFITAGDPDLATTAKALKILDACGSDVIELGVPYSDPLADGPVIQVHFRLYLYLSAFVFVMGYSVFCFTIISGRSIPCAEGRHYTQFCLSDAQGGYTGTVLPHCSLHILQPNSQAWSAELHE